MKRRIEREKRTVSKMIGMYCKKYHGMNGKLCDACRELNDYAFKRIDYCQFGENKPACSICPVHCYKLERRERIREVMRYAGPRMIYRHPYLAVMHIIDKRRYK
ncbi:MAG: nitrous oxide-stimulated promoter family protein [Bacteroidales bacterium]|nr:nitrous oxide-stimulated promoter family protein [Bacteroidales bacterium]